jgi:mono/diheme cytochrome c family protein
MGPYAMRRIVCSAAAMAGMLGCYLNLGENEHGHGHGGTAFDGGGAVMPGDLPCDVASALLACQTCHGPTPAGGAPISLATYADLTAQSLQYPGQTEAERAVARMTGNPSPMPPAPASPPPQTDIDALSGWIAAGYPQGTCGTTQSVCTSGLRGTSNESGNMLPGQACIACHQSRGGEAPIYDFMGTVYPTLHEPDDCVGASSSSYAGVQVTVIDAHGNEYSMSPNGAGNFMGSAGSFTMPFTAKVTYQGREIDMITPQTNGDCNSCHTETGSNGAPGRITLP